MSTSSNEKQYRTQKALDAFIEIGKAFTYFHPDEKQILQIAYEKFKAQSFTPVDNFSVVLHNKLTDELSVVIAFEQGRSVPKERLDYQYLSLLGMQKITAILQQNRPTILLRTRQESSQEFPKDPMASCWVGVPMNVHGLTTGKESGEREYVKTIGMFILYSDEEYGYDEEDVRLLGMLADLVANEFENTRLHQRFEILAAVQQQLALGKNKRGDSINSEEQLLELVNEQIQQLREIDTRNLSIILRHPKTKHHKLALLSKNGILCSVNDPVIQQKFFEHIPHSLIEKIAALPPGERLLLKNRQAVRQEFASTDKREQYACWVGVPMRVKEEVVTGVFIIYHETQEYAYDDIDAQLLDMVSDQAAIALENLRLIKLERGQREQAEVLKDVATIVNSSLDLKTVADGIFEQLARLIEYTSVSLQALNGDRREIIGYHGFFEHPEYPRKLLKNVSKDRLISSIVQSKTPKVLSETKLSKLWDVFEETKDINSWIGVPLIVQNQVIGILTIDHTRPGYYDKRAGELVLAFANQVAPALLNSQRMQAVVELNKVSSQLISIKRERNLRNVLENIVRSAKDILHADLVELYEYSQERNHYELPPIVGGERHSETRSVKIYEDDTVFKLIHESSPRYIKEAQTDPLLIASYQDDVPGRSKERFVIREGIQSVAIIPLRTENESMGLLFASYRSSQMFSDDQRELIELFAYHVAIAIKSHRLYELTQTRLSERINDFNALRNIYALIGRAELPTVLLQRILEKGVELTSSDYADLWLYNAQTHEIREEIDYKNRRKDVLYQEGGLRFNIFEQKSIVGHVVETRQTYICDDVTKDLYFFTVQGDVKSELAVPITYQHEIFGVLNFESVQFNGFTEEHVQLIAALAGQAAVAIHNARLTERLQQQNQRQDELIKLGKKLTSAIQASEFEILTAIYQSASSLMKTDTMYIALYDEQTQGVRFGLVYEHGMAVDIANTPKWHPRKVNQGGRTEWIIREKKPILLKTREEFKNWYSEPGRTKHSGTTIEPSWLGVPMIVGDKAIGVIAVHHDTQEFVYHDADRDFLLSIANQAAIALENAHLYQTGEIINHRLNVLIQIAQYITAGINLKESDVLELIYHQASERLLMRNFSIALYDELTDTVCFVLASRYGKRINLEEQAGWEPRTGGNGKTECIIKNKQPLLLNTREDVLASEKKRHKDWEKTIANGWLGVPMMVGNKAIGVLANYHYGENNFYKQEDIDIFQALANLAAIAIDNARYYNKIEKEVKDRTEKLYALIALGQMLSSSIQQKEDDILQSIYENTTKLMDTGNMFIALYNQSSDTVRFGLVYEKSRCVYKSGKGIDEKATKTYSPRSHGNGKSEWIIRNRTYLFQTTKSDVADWYRQQNGTDYVQLKDSPSSWVGVPMIVGRDVVGVIATYPDKEYYYTASDLEILQAMANLAAIALENSKLYEKARQLQDEVIASKQLSILSTAFGAIQHRISNTFDIINPNVRRLRKRVDITNQETSEILDIIERSVKYTSDIIARIQEPLKHSEIQEVDINDILQEIVQKKDEEWRTISSHASVIIKLNIADSLPLIRGSKELIAEVFRNLFDNAYRSMTKGGQLTVITQRFGEKIQIVVEDNGSGMSDEIKNRLFKKPVPSKEVGGRSGLGLWLNNLILQSLGGSISVKRTNATGTMILLEIPLPLTGVI